MNTHSEHKTKFDHDQWIQSAAKGLENLALFYKETVETLKIISKKFFLQGWDQTKFFYSRLTVWDYFWVGMNASVGFLAALVFLSGFGLVGYQVVLWLKDGVWSEYPLFMVFNFIFENTALHSWVQQPESWYGLQKVVVWTLENIPLSLSLIVPGMLVATLTIGTVIITAMVRFYQFKEPQNS